MGVWRGVWKCGQILQNGLAGDDIKRDYRDLTLSNSSKLDDEIIDAYVHINRNKLNALLFMMGLTGMLTQSQNAYIINVDLLILTLL